MTKKKGDQEHINLAQEGDLGRRLTELRESAGYSLSQTAEAMCLSEELLAQLENEDFDSLPEPPYIRGYLRNYAKFAEADPEELISCYESLRGADPSDLNYHFKTSAKIHSKQKKTASPVVMQLLFLAILLAGLVGLSMIPAVNQWVKTTWESFSVQDNPPSIDSTDNPLLTGTMPIPTPLPTDVSPINNGDASKNITESIGIPSTTNTVVSTNVSTELKPASSEAPKQTPNEQVVNKPVVDNIKVGKENTNEALIPAATDGSIRIKLIFNKEVWMRIRDAKKKTVFEGQNASGQEKELNLKKPLTFRVGNAQGLSLFVDDKAVDISRYIKGSVANFTLE